jgi:hypothetical protein
LRPRFGQQLHSLKSGRCFDDEIRRLALIDEETEQWEAAYRRIRAVVGLMTPDGRPVAEFLLHIDGADAWWRWSDKSFPEGEGQP